VVVHHHHPDRAWRRTIPGGPTNGTTTRGRPTNRTTTPGGPTNSTTTPGRPTNRTTRGRLRWLLALAHTPHRNGNRDSAHRSGNRRLHTP